MYELQIFILLVFLIFSGLFSGIETAFVAVTQIKARALKDQGKKGAAVLYRLKQNQRRLIITVLIGNNLVNIGASAYAAYIFTQIFGSAGVGIATAVMTLLILTFGEILPKTYFAKHHDTMALRFARFVYTLQILLYPFVLFFEMIATAFRLKNTKDKSLVTEREIKTMIEVGAEEDILHVKQMQFMQSVFEFDDKLVGEIMTPRIDVFGLLENLKIEDALKEIDLQGFSRIPIYQKSIDHITGYIHIKDLLLAKPNQTLKAISNKIKYVSKEKIIQELFLYFQKTRTHIAVVADEFGGTDGIVTMEDILEELVGEIMDESDDDEPIIRKLKRKTYIISGDAPLEDVNQDLNLTLTHKRNFISIGGYIQDHIKDFPKEGQEIVIKNKKVKIEVIKMSAKKIEKIQLTKL